MTAIATPRTIDSITRDFAVAKRDACQASRALATLHNLSSLDTIVRVRNTWLEAGRWRDTLERQLQALGSGNPERMREVGL